MSLPDLYLLCFAVGSLWTLAAVLLGGFHFGHGGHGHGHAHRGHASHHRQVSAGHTGHTNAPGKVTRAEAGGGNWLGNMINPSCAAIFLAWFGGVGYLLTRHSGLAFWADVSVAGLVGVSGAVLLAAFLRFLQSHEKPLDPAEYDMVGVLGRVTSTIRPDAVGELVYVRDGARKPAAARSEDGTQIARGEEVIVTRYERGVAYVRTWEAMTQRTPVATRPEAFLKEKEDVE
jgi:membrane protein implicated in regulation of membrane protease activity